jgi:hypothetical protein
MLERVEESMRSASGVVRERRKGGMALVEAVAATLIMACMC